MIVYNVKRSFVLGAVFVLLSGSALADPDSLFQKPDNDHSASQEQQQKMQNDFATANAGDNDSVDSSTIIPQRHEGSVAYVTGGVGDEETSYLNSVKKDYNLHVLSAEKGGAYVDNTTLNIYNKKGEKIFSNTIDPLFYAKLAPGVYTLRATAEGEEKEKKIVISKSSSDVTFYW